MCPQILLQFINIVLPMKECAGTPQYITHRWCLVKWRSSWCTGGVYSLGNDAHGRVTLVTMVRLFTSLTTSCHMPRCHARSCLTLVTTGLWQDAQITLSIIKHAQGERAVHSSWAWGRVMGLTDFENLPSLWECELSFLRGQCSFGWTTYDRRDAQAAHPV